LIEVEVGEMLFNVSVANPVGSTIRVSIVGGMTDTVVAMATVELVGEDIGVAIGRDEM
jgi:hypothetical protein